jgi:hypothetical protein
MAKRKGKGSLGAETLPPRAYSNTLQKRGPYPVLKGEPTYMIAAYAIGYVVELAARVRLRCSDVKLNNQERERDCHRLILVARVATAHVHRLAKTFPDQFRGIAERMPGFPCWFPAHPDQLNSLKDEMWNTFNLGRRHPLKLRPARARKTFSFETWVNKLLSDYICKLRDMAWREMVEDLEVSDSTLGFNHFLPAPTLTPQNAKQWLDAIWKLLLIDIPQPETHARLRQLVVRPSLNNKRTRRDGTVGEKTQAHNIRAAIKAKLGVYLKRMLNDLAVHK